MALNTEMTPADISAITGNNDGFGGNSFWIIILFLFAFCGWGGNWGNGGGYGQPNGISENYTLISDMGQLERKIDGVYSGICDSTFALNNAVKDGFAGATNVMTQGFAGLNTALVQNGYETRNAITQDTIANLQGFNGVNMAIKDCCCNTQSGLKDINFNMATQANGITTAINQGFCQTNFNSQQNTRDILENQNSNARAILDAIQANKIEALKDRIAEQNQLINALNLSASQTAQNAYLIEKLNPNPCPKPAYVVQPPQQVTFPNYSNGCGCNC